VAAANHDKEGLNLMVYNRCVGTRYCSNNCPYKVRRFNLFIYTSAYPNTVKMVQNPDVTVRSQGVMEKCSYCLQRINRAKMTAKSEGRQVKDGEAMTVCQQTCSSGAIAFGNILDKNSVIAERKSNNRNYQILAEFNTRPRTSYLAKLRNPNPTLDQGQSTSTGSNSQLPISMADSSLRQESNMLVESPLIAGNPTFQSVTNTISRIVDDKTRLNWYIVITFTGSLALLMFGMIGWLILRGVGIWGVNIPVGWGWAIVNFVFWVGIGHATNVSNMNHST
jgi:Fe-S-cluster-containing dehydrogenase component